MRMGKAITATQFKNKATRLVSIPAFEEDEEIQVLIKSASVMGMLTAGKLPNELLGVVQGLFTSKKTEEELGMELLKDTKQLDAIQAMLETVCKEVMVEPTYEDVKDFINDEQKQAIFNHAVGGVKQAIPSVQK